MKALDILLLLPLSGCALFGQNPNLSADQLKAVAADNKNNIFCNVTNAAGISTKTVLVTSDQTRSIDGTVTTEGNCDKITSSTTTVFPPPKPVVPKP